MLMRTQSVSASEGESTRHVRWPCGTNRSRTTADSASLTARQGRSPDGLSTEN
ncbi:hypothetical protein [Pelosinus sp. sgz500959]|uniref:hypothetical protein n=1 Tax=Pelosinus sp. sgz500959 TaxID=3242472 RepID=UPI00366AE939